MRSAVGGEAWTQIYIYITFRQHNLNKTKDAPDLRCAFSNVSSCQYGTLSHSTLSLGLLCLKNGAVWSLDDEHKGNVLETLQGGPGGAWDPVAVARRFPGVEACFRDEMLMEVLDWRIMLEEPGACVQISAALNDPQTLGLGAHEMELFSAVVDAADR